MNNFKICLNSRGLNYLRATVNISFPSTRISSIFNIWFVAVSCTCISIQLLFLVPVSLSNSCFLYLYLYPTPVSCTCISIQLELFNCFGLVFPLPLNVVPQTSRLFIKMLQKYLKKTGKRGAKSSYILLAWIPQLHPSFFKFKFNNTSPPH